MTAPAIEALIPHRPPMRMIEELVDWNDESAKARAVFHEPHLALRDGYVTEAAMVECMAQTVAAMEGARAMASQAAAGQLGMLCAVSDFTVVRRPAAGTPLEIVIRVQKRLGPMLLADGRILCYGEIVATGSLKLSV